MDNKKNTSLQGIGYNNRRRKGLYKRIKMKGTHDVVLSPVQYENIRMYFRDVRREVALTISKLIKLQSCVYNFQEYHRKASDFLVFLKSNMTLWQNEQTKYIKKDDGLNELEEWYSKYICKELIYYTLKYTCGNTNRALKFYQILMDRLENKLLDSIDVDYQRLYLQIIMRCVVIYNDNNDRHNSVILLVRSLDQHVIHIRMVEYFNMYDVTSSYTIKYNMSLKLLATTMFVALFIYLDLDDNIDRLYSIIEIISYISSNCLAYDTVFISAYKHVISNIYNTINEMNCIHEELIEIVSNNKLILLTSSKPTPLVVLGNRDRSYHFDKYLYQTNISKIVYNLLYTRDISYNKDQVIRTTMSTKNRMNNSSGYRKQYMMISDHSFSKLNNRRRNQTDNSMLINDTKYTSDKYSSSNASTNQYQIQPSSDTKDLNQSTKSRYKHQMHITKRSVSSSQDNLNESRSNFNKNTIKNKRSTSHGYTFENENSPYMRYDSLNRSNSNVNNKSYNNMSIHKRQIDNITIQFNKYLLHHKENTSILFNNNNTINISNCIYNDIIGNLKATGNQRHHTQNEERITDDDINDTTLKTETKPNKIEDLQQVERQYVKMKKNKEYWVSYLKNKKRSNIYNYHIQGNGKQDDELLSNDTIYNNIHNRNLSLSRANMANLSSSHISLNGKMNNSINRGNRNSNNINVSDNGDRTLGGGIITSDLKEGSPKIVKSELLKVLDHKQKEINLTNFFTLKNKDNHPSKYKYNSLYTKLKKISKNVVQKNNSLKNDDLYLNTHVNIVNNINKIHQENQNLMKVRKLKRHNSSTPLQDSKSPIVFRSRETSAGFGEKPKTNSKNGTQENNGYGLNSFIISSSLANSAKGLVPPKEKINWVKSFIVDLKTGVLFKDYNKRNMEDLSLQEMTHSHK